MSKTFEVTCTTIVKEIFQVEAATSQEAKQYLKKRLEETKNNRFDVEDSYIQDLGIQEHVDVYDYDNWIVEEVE